MDKFGSESEYFGDQESYIAGTIASTNNFYPPESVRTRKSSLFTIKSTSD